MEKRLILAITLSILVIIFFQMLMPQPKRVGIATSLSSEIASPRFTPTRPDLPRCSRGKSGRIGDRNDGELGARNDSYETTGAKEETIVETEKYILTFSNVGGSLASIQLKEHKNPETDLLLYLVKDAKGERAVFSVKSNTLINSLDKRIFNLTKKEPDRIIYTFLMPGRFAFTKEYRFSNSNDYIELEISIQNLGIDSIYKDYDLLGASSLTLSELSMGNRFFEIASMVDGKLVRSARVKDGEKFLKGIISWTGIKDRYFCVILKPLQDSEGVILKNFNKETLASGIRTKRTPIYPSSKVEDKYLLYVGPNDTNRLSKLGFDLEQIIDYGVFGGISKFLLAILRLFQRVTKNWGIAIILLTLLINTILFPLTRKSFMSMKKIQEVQPHIEKLRKLHKDNPQRLNKELAELYRQYNINPLGGCLPLLIQMPIFIALYQGLMRSIELKDANFLWIKDLSSPDSVSLPFNLPILGSQLHILPIFMVVAMFLQQLISTKSSPPASEEQKHQQRIMLIVFPIFFGFLFYKFPSGLVLYWLTNTILMTAEHLAMSRLNI